MTDAWKPISTAPERAEWILGWAPGWAVVEMSWVNTMPCVTLPEGMRMRGWYSPAARRLFSPTHWMPMPVPPQEEQKR